ncbi:MAG TPA: hypothetical protein VM327_07770 [Candidatus Thermoplasmatota archaeon]|nr:hypothetical protein [Candidatus Thermoplasmatota archaeon]
MTRIVDLLPTARLVLLPVALGMLLLAPTLSAQRPAAWPRNGSTVEYDLASSFTAPDGSYHQETASRLRLVFDGTAWSGTCTGTARETVDGTTTRSSWSASSGGEPARAPRDARRGSTVTVPLFEGVDIAEGCRQRAETVHVVGHKRQVTTGVEPAGTSPYQDVSIAWDRGTGLVLDWSKAFRDGSSSGRLVES